MTGGTDELRERLRAYAAAYLPQWAYERDGPEPEAALLTAMGLLLEDSLARLERLPEEHEAEFLRGFGLPRRERTPAKAYAALSAPEGRPVPARSAFYLSGDGTRVWRTEQDAWAEDSRLSDLFLSGGGGKLIPLPLPRADKPIKLFDFRPPGIQRRSARFSHPDLFASRLGCRASLCLSGASSELISFLSGGEAAWTLEGGDGPLPIPAPRAEGRTLIFDLPPSPGARALAVRVPDGVIPPEGAAGRVLASGRRGGETGRAGLEADLIVTDDGACSGGGWLPFGEEPGPWKLCQIACADAFSLRGAEITASWSMTFQEREQLLPGGGQEPEYKAVMRTLPPLPPAVRDVCADIVAWEYWNGRGWFPIPGAERYAGCFAPGEGGGRMEAQFPWPADAAACEIQGVEACWLRWRVKSAENSGWLPRRSFAPELSDLRFSASLENAGVEVERCWGMQGDPFVPVDGRSPLFPALAGERNSWWLGFRRPPRGGSFSFYLTLEGQFPGGRISAWEAVSPGRERPLTLEDGTGGLAHDGVLLLSGISGNRTSRFGLDRWWICLRDEGGTLGERGAYPLLRSLDCNVVRLEAADADQCAPGEALQPLRGGAVSGVTLTESFGGWPAETGRGWLERAEAARRHLGRAVSGSDIEELLRGAFQDVARVRCVRTRDRVEIGVLMRDVRRHAHALALRKPDLLHLLETDSVLPSLGITYAVREPRFYAVHVSAWIRPAKGADPQEVKQALTRALARFLHPVTGNFHGGGWPMGVLPAQAQIKSWLQTSAPGTALADLTLTAATPEGKEAVLAETGVPFALPVDGGGHNIYLI